MELDDLKQNWKQRDQQLDSVLKFHVKLLRDSRLGKAQGALRRLAILLSAGLVVDLVVLGASGSFLWTHAAQPRFLFIGLLIHACAIGLAASSLYQLIGIARLDYAAPVVRIQERLSTLRIARIRTWKWTLLLAPLLWLPILIALMQGFLDVDLFQHAALPWLVANFLFGVLVVAAGVWAGRKYSHRWHDANWWQKLLRDLAGSNLTVACDQLHEMQAYENLES